MLSSVLVNRLQAEGGIVLQAKAEVPAAAWCTTAAEPEAKPRTRTGTNQSYPRLEGQISLCKFVQAIGLRLGANGKGELAKAKRVLQMFGYANVSESSVKTALYDGSHPRTNKGAVNAQHKPAVLGPELGAALDSALLLAGN